MISECDRKCRLTYTTNSRSSLLKKKMRLSKFKQSSKGKNEAEFKLCVRSATVTNSHSSLCIFVYLLSLDTWRHKIHLYGNEKSLCICCSSFKILSCFSCGCNNILMNHMIWVVTVSFCVFFIS